jgi:hypothetical protein
VYDGDGDLLGIGEFYEGRVPMIQFKMAGLKVALISYSTLPKIEVNYKFSTDMFFLNVGGGYNTFDFEWVDAVGKKDESIDSYVVAVGGGLNMGAFYLNLHGHMGQNLGNYGVYNPMAEVYWDRGENDTAAIDDTGKVVDNDAYGFLAVAGFKVSEMLNFEAGYGFQSYEYDVDGIDADETMQYYVNATITIAPGFFIQPEIGMMDFDEDYEKAEQGDVTYFGAKWQINF